MVTTPYSHGSVPLSPCFFIWPGLINGDPTGCAAEMAGLALKQEWVKACAACGTEVGYCASLWVQPAVVKNVDICIGKSLAAEDLVHHMLAVLPLWERDLVFIKLYFCVDVIEKGA
jgi:hypothetical protein